MTLWWRGVQPSSSLIFTSAPRVTSMRMHFKFPSLTSWWKSGFAWPPWVLTSISVSTLGRFRNEHISDGSPSLTMSWKTKSWGNFTRRSIISFTGLWLGIKNLSSFTVSLEQQVFLGLSTARMFPSAFWSVGALAFQYRCVLTLISRCKMFCIWCLKSLLTNGRQRDPFIIFFQTE